MSDPFLQFCCSVIALHRRADAYSTKLGGALGVAADPYPHQLSNVRRILFDPRIRHLIADEVGLGKTIQALMVMNALRFQEPSHRTVVVAPDRLIEQWRVECSTRAHVRPHTPETAAGLDRDPTVLLVRPRDIVDQTIRLDPERFDLLVIDEPQTMPLRSIDMIATESVGDRFRQLLILSATPRLGEERWRNALMRLLEPELAGLARLQGVSLDAALAEREETALSHLQTGEADRRDEELAFRTSAAGRRVIRNGREDWGRYLPVRESKEIRVPPVRHEVDRFKLASDILNRAEDTGGMTTPRSTTARALQRGARAARGALETIGRIDPALAETGAELRERLAEDPGDSRLDALLDLLSDAWDRIPDEKFVIVCGDNPTIDMLQTTLPRYFPDLDGLIAVLRRPAAADTDTIQAIRGMHEIVSPFTSGSAKLLLVGDWVEAGLNLHHTSRSIVFYSLPWEPDSVDQLVGRIDRLRRHSYSKGDSGQQVGSVRVWRILPDGSQEAAIADAMDQLELFERPLPPLAAADRDDLIQIIKDAALGRLKSNGSLIKRLSERSGALHLATEMATLSPYTAAASEAQAASWREQIASGLDKLTGEQGSPIDVDESLVENWLRMMSRSGDVTIGFRRDRANDDVKFRTLWHRQNAQGWADPVFILPSVGTESWMSDHVPFVARRRHVRSPPVEMVLTDEGEPEGRWLRFLDHGDDVHDALLSAWQSKGDEAFGVDTQVKSAAIRVYEGHPCEDLVGSPIIISCALIGLNEIQDLYQQRTPAVDALIAQSVSEAQRAALANELRLARERWLAALRLYLDCMPPRALLQASIYRDRRWEDLPADRVWDCALPLAISEQVVGSRLMGQAFIPASAIMEARDLHAKKIAKRLRPHAKASEEAVRHISAQALCIQKDASERIAHHERELRRLEAEIPAVSQRDTWRGRIEAQRRLLDMARLSQEQLDSALKQLLESGQKTLKANSLIWILSRFYLES